MSVTSQTSRSSACACPTAVGSAAFFAPRPCRLEQSNTASWQQSKAAMQHFSTWMHPRGVRRVGSHAAFAPNGFSGAPASSRNFLASSWPPPQVYSLVASYAALPLGCRWGCAPIVSSCRAVGSAAADTGLPGAGPPYPSHDRGEALASSAAPMPPQSPVQHQHSGTQREHVALTSSNGHSLSEAALMAAMQLNGGSGTSDALVTPATTTTTSAGEAGVVGRPPVAAPQAYPNAGATGVDGLDETRKFVFADEWGFSRVGGDLPDGTTPATFADMFPERYFAFNPLRAVAAVVLPLAAMAVGYGWLWYMHSICPAWQQLACAALIGTAYTGLFKVAHECARFSFLPESPRLQDALGLLLMLPSLYPFTSWRLHFIHHLAHLNMLWEDTFGWHPYTKLQLATELLLGQRWRLALRRLALATPLKLFASVGHWLRSFDGLDLKRFHKDTYWAVLAGWSGPILFVGFGIPAIIRAFGVSGLVSGYLLPWLVFHFWLSTLSLLQHTAPHIPFRAEDGGYDSGRAAICGTVTVRLPRPLELLLNDANYSIPQLVAPGMPMFHVREAYEYMRERLLPYLTEATLSVKLLTNHVTKWQVYDAEKETYLPLDVVMQELERDLAILMEEAEKAEEEEEVAAGAAGGAVEGTVGQAGNGADPAFA